MSDNNSSAWTLVVFGIILIVLGYIVFIFSSLIPKSATQEIAPINNPTPEVYEVETDTTYYYSVWIMPNGKKTVYICYQGNGPTFGMAQAVHPDGTPVTPEELGIVVPQDMDKENQSP